MFKLNFLIFILFFSYLSFSNDCAFSFEDLSIDEQGKTIAWLEESGIRNIQDFLDIKKQLGEELPTGLFKHYKKYLEEQLGSFIEENQKVKKEPVVESPNENQDGISEIRELENGIQEWDDDFEDLDFETLEENQKVKKEPVVRNFKEPSEEISKILDFENVDLSSDSKNKQQKRNEVSKKTRVCTLKEFQEIWEEEGGFESLEKYLKNIPRLTKKYNRSFSVDPNRLYKLKGEERFFQKESIVSFIEAQKFMRKYGVGSSFQYEKMRLDIQKREGILLPSRPDRYYDRWKGWNDFLGVLSSVPIEVAKKFMRKYKVGSSSQYEKLRKKIQTLEGIRLPSNPNGHYDRWKGWNDFLGTLLPVPIEEAKKFMRKYKVGSSSQYRKLRKKIQMLEGIRLPSKPDRYYGRRKEWKGWKDFLGT